MLAARLHEEGLELHLDEVPPPRPAAGEVLVEVRALTGGGADVPVDRSVGRTHRGDRNPVWTPEEIATMRLCFISANMLQGESPTRPTELIIGGSELLVMQRGRSVSRLDATHRSTTRAAALLARSGNAAGVTE
jgi:hypothetical protein